MKVLNQSHQYHFHEDQIYLLKMPVFMGNSNHADLKKSASLKQKQKSLQIMSAVAKKKTLISKQNQKIHALISLR